MRYFILLICIGISQWLLAQDVIPIYQQELQKADEAFVNKRYYTAAGYYQKAYTRIKDAELKQNTLFKIAESYRRSNNFQLAIKWFEDVVNSKYPDPSVLYSYGQLLKNFERYEEASRQFYDYSFELPNDIKGKWAQQSCTIARVWKEHPEKFELINVKELNTEFSDYSPFTAGNQLIWASARKEAQGRETFEWTGQRYSDFFVSTRGNGTYSKAQALKGAVNTNYNDGTGWMDSTQTQLFFTQCNSADGRGTGCKIFVSYNHGNAWETPTPLPFNSDSFSCGHPALTENGKRLYFASDMPGGYGEKDIYYADYDAIHNQWSAPINAGPNVNTSEDDMFPTLDNAGNIYFSSKGWIGMGGFDIFKTRDSAGTFQQAQNVKYPINSGADDFNFSVMRSSERIHPLDYAFMSSNRAGGKGDDDIYIVRIKPYLFMVKGLVLERESKQALQASIQIQASKKEHSIQLNTNEKGQFIAELTLNEVYALVATKPNYFAGTAISINTLQITHDSTLELVIYLDAIPPPEYDFTLQGVYYDIDKADLRPESKTVLDSLVSILQNNPGLVIELASHTDSRAAADYNLDLSKRRAKSCVDYLVNKGISKSRLVAVGYGETKLVNDCADGVDCSEEEHQQNRRTTFRVLRNEGK